MAEEYFVDPPYGAAVAGRGFEVRGQVRERTDGGTEAGKDISASKWVVTLRAYATDSSSGFVIDTGATSMTKSSGTSGYYSSTVVLTRTPYIAALTWEEVLKDTSVVDANTASGFQERVLRRWRQPIERAPPQAS